MILRLLYHHKTDFSRRNVNIFIKIINKESNFIIAIKNNPDKEENNKN